MALPHIACSQERMHQPSAARSQEHTTRMPITRTDIWTLPLQTLLVACTEPMPWQRPTAQAVVDLLCSGTA